MHLFLLSLFSERGAPAMAMSGEGNFTRMQTARSVEALMRDRGASDAPNKLTNALPQDVERLSTRYTVAKLPGSRAVMRLSMRLMNRDGLEISPPNPDITVDLQWVRSGKAGYWRAVSWRLTQ
jgi:hypothetical protein